MAITVFVQVDGLEDVVLKRDTFGELGLIVGSVEGHFELGEILVVHLDVVHWSEALSGKVIAGALVFAGQGCDSEVILIEVLVVFLHVV